MNDLWQISQSNNWASPASSVFLHRIKGWLSRLSTPQHRQVWDYPLLSPVDCIYKVESQAKGLHKMTKLNGGTTQLSYLLLNLQRDNTRNKEILLQAFNKSKTNNSLKQTIESNNSTANTNFADYAGIYQFRAYSIPTWNSWVQNIFFFFYIIEYRISNFHKMRNH